MKKILLTSTGFENDRLGNIFLKLIDKDPDDIHILWIPTILEKEQSILPSYMMDLLFLGIPQANIKTYHLDHPLSANELNEYDAIYVCGGDIEPLLKQMQQVNFITMLETFLSQGGVYVGVNNGSRVLCNDSYGFGYINCQLSFNQRSGHANGYIDLSNNPIIPLSTNQALFGLETNFQIIE